MIFNTPVFLFLFLPVALALFFFVPRKYKTVFLVLASIAFYTWGEGELIILLLLSVFFNYIAGLLLERYNNQAAGRFILIAAVLLNIGGLVFYKYTGFLAENLNIILSALDIPAITINPIYFPLGISFFTFQALSYLYDVYREVAPAEHNPVKAALYMTFFPKLISGPIIRYSDMKEQMDAGIQVSTTDVYEGLKRFITGLAKKVIIADNLALYANQVFSETTNELSAVSVWAGIVVYGLQMYYDFSGYTDMAIGAGRMFGFRLPENFNFPYAASSVTDFWRRWHMSLSFWFRDYFYTPVSLILARKWNAQTSIGISVFLAFVTIGLWHGAAWKFVVFGLIHATFIMWEMTRGNKYISRLWKPLQHFYAIAVILISTVFFRANDLTHAFAYLKQMFAGGFAAGQYNITMLPLTLVITVGGFILAMPWTLPAEKYLLRTSEKNSIFRMGYHSVLTVFLYLLLLVSLVFVAASGFSPFIYFQF